VKQVHPDEIEKEIIIVEEYLDSSLVTKHFADTTCFSIGLHFLINMLNVLPLAIGDQIHFPHTGVIHFLEV
jgi:hypothetical protein